MKILILGIYGMLGNNIYTILFSIKYKLYVQLEKKNIDDNIFILDHNEKIIFVYLT